VRVFLISALMVCGLAQAQTPQINPLARTVHNSAIVIDAHEDTPQRFLDENYDIDSKDPNDHDFLSLAKAREGNLSAEFFSIWVDPSANRGHYAHRALQLIDSVYLQVEHHPDQLMMAFSADDIETAHRQHKLAALIGIEGGHAIENNLAILRDFYRLGARYMTLTWSNTNEWADSAGDLDDAQIQHHNGLTDFGRQVVAEMNRLGMMVDISHASDKTFWDVIAVSKATIIASHSSARGLLDSRRNLSDDMLRAVGKNGGLVAVNFGAAFLDETFQKNQVQQHMAMAAAVKEYDAKRQAMGQPVTPEDEQRFDSEWLRQHPIPRPPLKALIDHIDHVAKVAGIDHVGLGSDFDGENFFPQGIDSAADLPKITRALLDRGYSPADIHKILGGNMLRVFREVEKVGQTLRNSQGTRSGK
jgi:membrane dipeptidase